MSKLGLNIILLFCCLLFLLIKSWSSFRHMYAGKRYISNPNFTNSYKLDRVAPVDNRPPTDKKQWCHAWEVVDSRIFPHRALKNGEVFQIGPKYFVDFFDTMLLSAHIESQWLQYAEFLTKSVKRANTAFGLTGVLFGISGTQLM